MAEFTFRTGANEVPTKERPTCKPCGENSHGRCPTVLAKHQVFDSTFDCACHFADEPMHEEEFQERQEEIHGDYHDGGYFHPETDYPTAYRRARVMHREARRWGGVDY